MTHGVGGRPPDESNRSEWGDLPHEQTVNCWCQPELVYEGMEGEVYSHRLRGEICPPEAIREAVGQLQMDMILNDQQR